jgi:hypothetical protein
VAQRSGRLGVTPARRRSAFAIALLAVVALLVGGRWAAMETAERAWAASVAGGDVYLTMRDMGRLVHGLVLLVAMTWGVGNLYRVYRTIGSVQLPRRLGDLEIVEEVPHRVLLGTTLTLGVVYGLLLGLGSGDWWLRADLAAHPPHFGITDPVLSRDLGYYVGELPWAVTCERFALVAALTALVATGLLYAGIGSLRLRGWRPVASAHARAHLGLLLTVLAAVCMWGAALDPARAVGGMRTLADPAAVGVRVVGARLTAALAAAAGVASLWWVVRDRAEPMLASWILLVLALAAANVAALGVARPPSDAPDSARAQFEERAFAGAWSTDAWPQGFPGAARAIAAMPAWDEARVAVVVTRAPGGRAVAALTRPVDEHPTWLVVPALPAGTRPPAGPTSGGAQGVAPGVSNRPLVVTELDSSLAVRPASTRDSTLWFGPGFADFALAPARVTALRPSAVTLDEWWRRGAFAWVLQSPELVRATGDSDLIWRRDVSDRLDRLIPFAQFAPPLPVIADSTLLWVSYGYVTSDVFPLVRGLPFPGTNHVVRYVNAGLIGTVAAATGATTIYLAPGADSLVTAWARLFTPLVHPADALPPALETELPYPTAAFRLAAAALERLRGDSAWRLLREPYQLAAPLAPADSAAMRLWTAVGFEVGEPPKLAALLAGTMTPTGPRLYVWRPGTPVRDPAELLGSPETAPGLLRLWSADGGVFTEQALFDEPASGSAPKGVSQVYLTWGDREGQGPSAAAALRTLESGGVHVTPADTSLAARWDVARRLAAAADSALAAGDLTTFARHYAELARILGVRRLAPPPRAR